jgi:hypothetical protein
VRPKRVWPFAALFPPIDNMLRVTMGTDAEMAKFRDVFWKVYEG